MSSSNRNRRDEYRNDGAGGYSRELDINDIKTSNAYLDNALITKSNSISRFCAMYTAESRGSDIFQDSGMVTLEPSGHGLSGATSAYRVMPAHVAPGVTCADSAHAAFSMHLMNTGHENAVGINNFINFTKLIKNIRVVGLIAVISYMIVILFTWIYANYTGYVYFSAGEPMLIIKYPEWVLGFTGIFVAIDCLHKELKDESLW